MNADLCCVACDFYTVPTPPTRAGADAGRIPPGFCHRYPQAVSKALNDWCGEHSSRKGGKHAK